MGLHITQLCERSRLFPAGCGHPLWHCAPQHMWMHMLLFWMTVSPTEMRPCHFKVWLTESLARFLLSCCSLKTWTPHLIIVIWLSVRYQGRLWLTVYVVRNHSHHSNDVLFYSYPHIPLKERVKVSQNWCHGMCRKHVPLKWKIKWVSLDAFQRMFMLTCWWSDQHG